MHKRKLGTQGLEVSALGLGTMGMSASDSAPAIYGDVDPDEARRTLHRAIELGVNFFDTAEVYGPFTNEELLGRAFAGKRDQIILATKFGFQITADGAIAGVNGKPEHALEVLDASLARLRTSYIDLWYLHRLDKNIPIEDTVGAMARAVTMGKVRYLGLSEVGAKTLERAAAVHPISALQSEYSVWERNIEGNVLDTARRLKIGIVPFCPLGRGFLSGTAKPAEEYPSGDYRREDFRYQPANFLANQHILATLRSVAARHAATTAQIALAWLLHQGTDVVPIPGTKRQRYLEENSIATEIKLSAGDLGELALKIPSGSTAGARYGEEMMASVDR